MSQPKCYVAVSGTKSNRVLGKCFKAATWLGGAVTVSGSLLACGAALRQNDARNPHTYEMKTPAHVTEPSTVIKHGVVPTPLSEGEKELVRGIFGDQINTVAVRQYKFPFYKGGVAADVDWDDNYNNVRYYTVENHAEDAAKTNSVWKFDIHIHELTHVWQAQRAASGKPIARGCHTYDYIIKEDSKLSDFCTEQQANLVSDYARTYLFASKEKMRRNVSCLFYFTQACTRKQEQLIAKVVEEALPAARATRMARDAQKDIYPQ